MAKTIKAILKKKSWTGKEVGYALLLSLANDIENMGNPNKKTVLSQEDYERMVNSLSDGKEYEDYRVYSKIYNAVVDSTDYRQAIEQQFFNGYYRYFLAFEMAQRAEVFLKTAEELPLILTKSQYDKLAAECEAQKKAATESYYSLFFHAVAFFVDAIEDNRADIVPKGVRAAILETKSQPVTNERILVNWAEDMGEGYYTLPDGRRSDNMTSEEWRTATEADFMETHKYYINGELQDYSATAEHYHEERLLKTFELLYKGREAIKKAYEEKTGEMLQEKYISGVEKALEEIIDGKEEVMETEEERIAGILFGEGESCQEWHFYTEPPETLTKYDILAERETLGRYSGSYSTRLLESGGSHVKEISEREQLREFKKDYPSLADAVKKYLKKTIQAVQGLKVSQYYSPLITWGELAEIGFLDFQTLTAATDQDIASHAAGTQGEAEESNGGQISGKRHGIAILNAVPGESENYIDPIAKRANKDAFQSIDYLILNPKEADYIQLIYDRLIAPALRYIYAFDAFIDVLAGVYDIDFLKIAKFDEEIIEGQTKTFNSLIHILFKDVCGTQEDKKRKRDFLRWYFPPIEVENFKPPRDVLNRLADTLESFNSKETADTLGEYKAIISMLMEEGG